ncbi:MAG: hypothetical protein ACRD3L_07635 [Terriglobales bacterium]
MRQPLTIALLLLLTALSSLAAKETLQEMIARADAARAEDQPGLYIDIAEHQLKTVDDLFRGGKDSEAVAAVKDVVTYSKKAHDAAIMTRKKLKGTEISLRKMAAKLRDLDRTLTYDQQPPVEAASDRLETMRTDLLAQMFGKGK